MRLSPAYWLKLHREPWRKVFHRSFRRWRKDRMELRRFELTGLGPDSMVFDIGGFEGGWADRISARYGCRVHIFEPHPRFAEELELKFAGNDRVTVHPFALGSTDGTLDLSDAGDASSAVSGAQTSVRGKVVDVARFMTQFPEKRIALAKINIEGGEYDLLPALSAAGELARFDTIQVQFHLFGPENISMRDRIRESLARTHREDWAYEFVWEQWSRIDLV